MGGLYPQSDHPGDFVPIFHRFCQPFSDTTKRETPFFTRETNATWRPRRKSNQHSKIEIVDLSIFSRFCFGVSRFYFSGSPNRSLVRGVGQKMRLRHADPKVKSESRKVKSRGLFSGANFGGLKWRLRSWWIVDFEIGVSGDLGLDFGEKSVENRNGIWVDWKRGHGCTQC